MKKTIIMGLALSVMSYGAQANFMQPNTEIDATGKHVVINIPQLRLFVYENGKLAKSFPIAVGKGRTQTPPGEYRIGAKAFNPTWTVPPSIRRDRAKKGLPAITSVPPGPKNPLGPVFVRFGDPKLGLGIHGTSNPSSVPSFASYGCVRLKNPNALEFARYIDTGSRVSVLYQQGMVNVDGNNNVWLAVYKDPYNLKKLDNNQVKSQVNDVAKKYGKTVNDKLLTQVLANRSGQLNCLTCGQGSKKVQGSLKPVAQTLAKATAPSQSVSPAGGTSTPISTPDAESEYFIQPHTPVDWNSQLPVSGNDSFTRLW